MKLVWSLKYGVWYSIYSVEVKYSKVAVMVGQNRYSELRIPSQLHTLWKCTCTEQRPSILSINNRQEEAQKGNLMLTFI